MAKLYLEECALQLEQVMIPCSITYWVSEESERAAYDYLATVFWKTCIALMIRHSCIEPSDLTYITNGCQYMISKSPFRNALM